MLFGWQITHFKSIYLSKNYTFPLESAIFSENLT
jgi:hypothetical protein